MRRNVLYVALCEGRREAVTGVEIAHHIANHESAHDEALRPEEMPLRWRIAARRIAARFWFHRPNRQILCHGSASHPELFLAAPHCSLSGWRSRTHRQRHVAAGCLPMIPSESPRRRRPASRRGSRTTPFALPASLRISKTGQACEANEFRRLPGSARVLSMERIAIQRNRSRHSALGSHCVAYTGTELDDAPPTLNWRFICPDGTLGTVTFTW